MQFNVYDSLTRKKQPLLPDGQRELSMYVCGPTVYDHIHVGNARTFAMFQVFARYLRFAGIDVKVVRNVTDINDKIYDAATTRGMGSAELATTATGWFQGEMDRLGLGRPDSEPRATDHVDGMVRMIEELIERGMAYAAGGDVYFRVSAFPDYGKLSNRNVDDMLSGSRDDLDEGEGKEAPVDFALWKATKPGEDTSWDSPWGKGRPGWHIECSVMAEAELGDSFDVHAGGLDLLFPHHENEVAQSKGAGLPFARLWMHAGMLELGGDKMSKSDGNIEKLADVLERVPRHVLLLFYYTALYRNPLEWSDESLEAARVQGQRITEALRRSERYLGSVETRNVGDHGFADSRREWEGIHEALHDDFNTPAALAEMNGLVFDLNTAVDEHATPQIVRNLRKAIDEFLEVFGLQGLRPDPVDVSVEASELIRQRDEARTKKDWEASDRLRAELEQLGYVVRDTGHGTELLHGDGAEADAPGAADADADPLGDDAVPADPDPDAEPDDDAVAALESADEDEPSRAGV